MTGRYTWRWTLLAAPLIGVILLAVAPVAQAQRDPSYLIGSEDVLDVQVWDNKDLNQVVFVRPDGKISLPLAGEVQATGKTVQQLTADLVVEYSKTVRNPTVTVIVREIKSRPVFFVGGWGKPGVLQLMRELTLVQAISVVGGITAGGAGERGYLLRADRRIPIDFVRLVQEGDQKQNLKLEVGDTVVVPVADSIFVEGEVKRPGPQKYTGELTALRAIAQAGGLTPLAAGGRVDVLRDEGEKKVRIRIDLDKMLRTPEENPDMQMKPNDIVIVPQRLF